MAIANLHETLLAYTLRKSDLENEIQSLSSQKNLMALQQGDVRSALSHEKRSAVAEFKAMWEEQYELYGEDFKHEYIDFTKLPEYDVIIDEITAKFQEEIDELTAAEEALDNQITVDSTELEEINAYTEKYKSMLSSNIQEDFNYGLGS